MLIGCGDVECTCPACEERHTRKRARRVRGVLERAAGRLGFDRPGLIQCTFTVPDSVRDDCDQAALARLRRKVREILQYHLPIGSGMEPAVRGRPGWSLGIVDTVHPEGDKEPGAWAPHICVVIPSLVYHAGRSAWAHIGLFQSKQTLYLIRCAWGIALHEVLGWPGEVDRCDFHLEYADPSDMKKWNHVVRYNFRHWPRYAGDFRRVVWSGWLSPRRLADVGLGGVLEDKLPGDLVEPTTIRCPICGSDPDCKVAIYSGPWKKQVPDWMVHAVTEQGDTT